MTFSKNPLADFLFGALFTAGLLGTLALLPMQFARHSWMFDLMTHFQVQLALGMLAVSGLLLFSAMRKFSLLFLAVAGIYLMRILPFYLPADQPASGTPFKMVLLNVNSGSGDPERVQAYLSQSDADVLVIQEFSSRWVKLLEALKARYPHQFLEIREDNFGMALLSRFPMLAQEAFYFTDEELPSLSAEFRIGAQRLFLLATHPLPPMGAAATEARDRQLQEVAAFMKDLPGPRLLVGDLNTGPWSPVFRDLVRESGLRNSMQGFGVQPTWPDGMPLLRIPLDHLLHSADCGVTARRTGPALGSDHFPLEISLLVP